MCMSSRLYDIGNKIETSLNIFKYICGKPVDILVLNGASSKTKTLARSTILILCFIQRISSIVIWIDSFSHCGSVYWMSVTSICDSIFCIHHVTQTIGSYKNFGNTQMSGLTCVFELVNCSKQRRIDFMKMRVSMNCFQGVGGLRISLNVKSLTFSSIKSGPLAISLYS